MSIDGKEGNERVISRRRLVPAELAKARTNVADDVVKVSVAYSHKTAASSPANVPETHDQSSNFRISDIYQARTANDILLFLQNLDASVSNLPGSILGLIRAVADEKANTTSSDDPADVTNK